MLSQQPSYPRFTGSEPCRSTDPEIFYPDTFSPSHHALVKQICEWCPMREPCAEWAIAYEHDGYWGGLSAAERRKIRRQRGIVIRSSELRQSVA